jgi:hypothetical protein
MKFKGWFESFLMESKQSIIGLRYPEIIAKLLYKRFGQNAFIIAKWYRESRFSDKVPDNWWLQITGDFRRTPSLYDLTTLYAATTSEEEYLKVLDKLELSRDDFVDLEEQRQALKVQIEKQFFDDFFFTYSLPADIMSGKLKDMSPYKNLTFWDAQYKYDEKNIFQDTTPVKTYKNGFKWINVGKRCTVVGHKMRNCGSAGLMSLDSSAVMIVLFGPENTPHVVVTYSPKEKRISGDQGGASTEVKSKYHSYILDLAKTLEATFDADKSKSTFLKMKYLLQGKATNLRQINQDSAYDKLFMFNMQGKVYYSNGQVAVTKEDVEKAQNAIKQGVLTLQSKQRSMIKNIFSHRNQDMLAKFGVKYIMLWQI